MYTVSIQTLVFLTPITETRKVLIYLNIHPSLPPDIQLNGEPVAKN